MRTIERAYELARGGECKTMDDLKKRLRREGLESVDAHLSGKLIKSQLIDLMARAEGAVAPSKGQASGE